MRNQGWRIGTLVLAASLALAGCSAEEDTTSSNPDSGPVTGENPAPPPIVDETPPGPAPDPVPAPDPAPGANSAPVVSGEPSGSAVMGQAWTFQPSASDADGDAITWSISGKPTDATFSPTSGQLVWTPSSSGTWTDIVITATDSRGASASLPAFSVAVDAPQQVAGTATLSWDMPQHYTDGAPLLPEDQVVGYRVYHGTSEGTLNEIIPVNDPATLQHQMTQLAAGTHYFAVSAVSVTGAEGERSEILSKTVM